MQKIKLQMKGMQGQGAHNKGVAATTHTDNSTEISMIKAFILPAMMAVALTTGGVAFAAAPAPVKATPVVAKTGLSHEQVKEIHKACHAEHKGSKAAYKACVQEKAKEATAATK